MFTDVSIFHKTLANQRRKIIKHRLITIFFFFFVAKRLQSKNGVPYDNEKRDPDLLKILINNKASIYQSLLNFRIILKNISFELSIII